MAESAYTDEIWKSIPGFEGRYEASSLGRIRSIQAHGRARKHPYILSFCPKSGQKYHQVQLYDGRRGVQRTYHTVICEAFHGKRRHPQQIVAHLNGNASDNRPGNLMWVTRRSNSLHRVIHMKAQSKNPHAKISLDKLERCVSIILGASFPTDEDREWASEIKSAFDAS